METKNEKTRLQIIKEQIRRKMTRAIVAAIEDGAKCEPRADGSLYIDGIYLSPKFCTEYHGLILDINAPEIEQLLVNSNLERRAEELRAELEEIENKLKSK